MRSPRSRWLKRWGLVGGRAYVDCIARNLEPGGRAALQFISMRAANCSIAMHRNADFIQIYIFPGGMLLDELEV